MINRSHPSHAKTTRVAMLVLALISVAPFVAAFYAARVLNDSNLETIFSILFMVVLASIMLIGALQDYISKCTECKSWIVRQEKTYSDEKTIKFVCSKCGIIWDSGMEIGD